MGDVPPGPLPLLPLCHCSRYVIEQTSESVPAHDKDEKGGQMMELVVAFIGAVILIYILRAVTGKRFRLPQLRS
jgi:hypothetical protein